MPAATETGARPVLASTGGDLLRVEDLTVRFGDHTVFEGLNVAARAGEVLFLMGGSGCGKTTLLKCMAGLLVPSQGRVLFRGRPLEPEHGPVLHELRRSAGMVFQGGALLGSLTLAENVALPLRVQLRDLPERLVREVVSMRLAQVGLLDAADRLPAQLSGGMRKRAGIARALALDPPLLFLDEPTSGLDPITADEMDELVGNLGERGQLTVVVVSHDLQSAAKLADQVALLGEGRLLAQGSWEEIQADDDEQVRAFLDRRAPVHEGDGQEWEDA